MDSFTKTLQTSNLTKNIPFIQKYALTCLFIQLWTFWSLSLFSLFQKSKKFPKLCNFLSIIYKIFHLKEDSGLFQPAEFHIQVPLSLMLTFLFYPLLQIFRLQISKEDFVMKHLKLLVWLKLN